MRLDRLPSDASTWKGATTHFDPVDSRNKLGDRDPVLTTLRTFSPFPSNSRVCQRIGQDSLEIDTRNEKEKICGM